MAERVAVADSGTNLMWSDLMELTIVPVLEDQALSEVLQRISK